MAFTSRLEELAEGVFRVRTTFAGRPLHLYLLAGEKRMLLIDAGSAAVLGETVLPALKALGRGLDEVIVTHPDLDHQGGVAGLLRSFPSLQVSCGAGDEQLVSDPRRLVFDRYSAYEPEHGVGYVPEVKPGLLAAAGAVCCRVDHTYLGGERAWLGNEWEVEVLRVPGHSRGHLAIFDRRSRLLIAQDAFHGRDYPFADGRPWALMPTYLYVEPYLESIARVRTMEFAVLYTAHWPDARAGQVVRFLDESRDFCLEADAAIYQHVEAHPGVGLKEVIESVLPELGDWDRSLMTDFMFAAAGHLTRMTQAGILGTERKEARLRYKAVRPYVSPLERKP